MTQRTCHTIPIPYRTMSSQCRVVSKPKKRTRREEDTVASCRKLKEFDVSFVCKPLGIHHGRVVGDGETDPSIHRGFEFERQEKSTGAIRTHEIGLREGYHRVRIKGKKKKTEKRKRKRLPRMHSNRGEERGRIDFVPSSAASTGGIDRESM